MHDTEMGSGEKNLRTKSQIGFEGERPDAHSYGSCSPRVAVEAQGALRPRRFAASPAF